MKDYKVKGPFNIQRIQYETVAFWYSVFHLSNNGTIDAGRYLIEIAVEGKAMAIEVYSKETEDTVARPLIECTIDNIEDKLNMPIKYFEK